MVSCETSKQTNQLHDDVYCIFYPKKGKQTKKALQILLQETRSNKTCVIASCRASEAKKHYSLKVLGKKYYTPASYCLRGFMPQPQTVCSILDEGSHQIFMQLNY